MSTSSIKTQSPEPLKSLLAAIREARELPEAPAYQPDGGDPLERLSRVMRGEEPALGDESDGGAEVARAEPNPGGSGSVEAALGREVLGLLRAQPLPGPARAAAAEMLVAQLSALASADSSARGAAQADALRAILSVLVTAQHD